MKNYLLSFLTILSFYSYSFADQIHLQDGTIIKGQIIQLTEKYIEYNPEGNRPFDMCPRGQVKKIVYDDGRVVQYSFKDKIYRHDGVVIKCRIDKVTADNIFYYTTDSRQKYSINRKDVAKMTFGHDAIAESADEPEPEVDDNKIHSDGFIDSILQISVFSGGDGDLALEEIEEKENRINEKEAENLESKNIVLREAEYQKLYYGFDADIMLHTIKDPQSRGFDYTGVNFGIKTRYTSMSIMQIMCVEYNTNDNDGNSNLSCYNLELIEYNSIGAGPELNIIFSPRGNSFNMVIYTYLLYEYIYKGSLFASPVLQKLEVPDLEPGYSELGGYCITAGIGLDFVLNYRWFPVIVGFNLNYSTIRLKLDNAISSYDDGDKSITMKGVDFELSLGIHVF